ncbi:hypothetical protein Dsin_006961 [Dipteronia sinensis]|uniref:ABC transporter domain-containing protein n=1 Tax=Dipteronia sinensis TaxID=43782 RepID=A0AAE0B0Q7_9ROSI|nr:hypothetical protein Dsin_006961 [Dipteronia sinensis]
MITCSLAHTPFKMHQISSDMIILDNDLPISINLAAIATIDVLMTIEMMASITWHVLIVVIPTFIIAKYIQIVVILIVVLLIVLLPRKCLLEDISPPASWPLEGRIKLENLKVRYSPNAQFVMKGITCTFEEGTRVGVVGRTESGKSTLISALFRLVDLESGRILIDGLDICSIRLEDLRTKLSIVPQEPTVF